jgi:hypothetical protein
MPKILHYQTRQIYRVPTYIGTDHAFATLPRRSLPHYSISGSRREIDSNGGFDCEREEVWYK